MRRLYDWLFYVQPSRPDYWQCPGCGVAVPVGYWHQCKGRGQFERQAA